MLSAVNPRLTLNVGGTNKPLSGYLQRRRYAYRVYDHGIGSYITRSRNTNEPEFHYTVAKDDRETNGISIAADALDRVDLAPTGLLVFSPRRGPRRRRSP